VFAENPLLGSGTNSFPTVTGGRLVAHNSFISVLTETGLVGFGLVLAIGTLTFTSVWSRPFWERLFWLTLLSVLMIGISTLTWEHRKPLWVILSFAVIAGNLADSRSSNLLQSGESPLVRLT
jgi:O-antigen ligase